MGYQQIATVHKDTEGTDNPRMGRIDKLFMVHKQVVSAKGVVYFDWADFLQMAEAGVEMWNIHEFGCERCGRDLPFKKYPLDEIIEKFDLGYFSDTICYQIAFALHEATEGCRKDHNLKLKYPLKIRLYGVDLQDREEYGEEKGGVECWIGYALGLGVDVTISHGSTLLLTNNGAPYGFDVVNQKLYDPYKLLADKYPPADGSERMNEEEFQAHFDEIIETIEKMTCDIFPDYAKYQGEGAKGLHREDIPVLEIKDDNPA